MLPHARALLGAVLTAAVLVSAGCGSSSSKDDNSPTTAAKAATPKPAPATAAQPATTTQPDSTLKAIPTKAAYVRAADKVCRQAHDVSKSANTAVQKAFAVNDLSRAADTIDNYTPMFAQRIAQLKALPRPKGADDAKLLAGLMKVMDSQVQALHDEASALRSQDNTTLQQIAKAQQTELQFADTLGRQYGFRVCGLAA